jgi:catechol 2,3-dioxygenase-like lactoylglutathione lyase family enzyme
MIAHFILYVRDQKRSREFYARLLEMEPILDVPGMTEFKLSDSCVLGLMPEIGIKKLLGPKFPDPSQASRVPRAEIYLLREDAPDFYKRALEEGATSLSEMAMRDWGHVVGYCLDPDGHVLAFARAVDRGR